MQRTSQHGNWSSRAAFILAAVGSAVGLGNIWKFPYEAGQGGGAAFVAIYLLCVFAVGVPVMIAELSLGRRGRGSPPKSLELVATDEGQSKAWSGVGWIGTIGAFLVLSFYSVIGGWTLYYVLTSAMGGLENITADASGALFNGFLADSWGLIGWHIAFMAITIFIVARGIQGGLEKAVTFLMPALFVLLVGLAIYSVTTGDGAAAIKFLFAPDFSKVNADVVLQALGQAFFSLSLALGTMLAYGAYLPEDVSIPRSSLIIAGADTGVALLAGLVIFPIVFAYGLEAGAGPGLIFVTLPIAFGQMVGGQIVGTLFFVLLAIAAVTSSISLLEPVVSWLEEHRGFKRPIAAITAGGAIFTVGLGTVFSFNHWAEVKFFGRTVFDNLDFLTNNIMMPLGGLLMVVFVGWFVSRKSMRSELHTITDGQFNIWYAMARYICPIALIIIFLSVIGVF